MDTRNSENKRRLRLSLILATIALFLAGCDLKITDLTPSSMKANPSNVYTITTQVRVKNSAVREGTVQPEVVIDGRAQPMSPAPGNPNLYEYDYQMSPGRNSATYYILVKYDKKTASKSNVTKETYTELSSFAVEQRYSVELEVDRAPVGAKVAILGRGFTRDDKVLVGGTPAATRLESATSLAFYVPTIAEGRNYEVKVLGLNGELPAGFLRVDGSQIRVTFSDAPLSEGERRTIAFMIPQAAPPGGLRVDVTTDIPESVIMPEVMIPSGSRSTSVSIEGGRPGQGSLFVEVPGYNEIVLPVTVR